MSRKDLSIQIASSVLLAGFLLTGCSKSGYYYDRAEDYADAKEYPALQLPATADASRFNQVMPLPEIRGQETLDTAFVVPRPDALPVVDEDLPLSELKEFAGVEGISPRLWLSVSNNPAVVWPLLQRQFEQLNWSVTSANPSSGRLRFVPDTQLNPRPVDAVLRQGLRGGFSDLELLTPKGDVRTDSAAKSLLSQLQAGLSEQATDSQSVSLLAQNISREKILILQAAGGQDPVLKLGADAERAWIGLELLLTEQLTGNEQRLLSADAGQKSFTLVWVPEDKRSSILTRWASSPGAEHQYQLVLSGSSPVSLRVQQNGKPVDTRQAREILTGIRKLLN